MTGRAGTDATACVIDGDSVRESNIQNAAWKARHAIRDLFWIDFHRDVHGKKGDRKFLSRRSRRLMIVVGVGATLTLILPLFPSFSVRRCFYAFFLEAFLKLCFRVRNQFSVS